jgi:uncharacterized protein (TIGR02453 family)
MSATPTAGEFTGFPVETFRFLLELTANNAKPWFDAHRADYEAYYLRPAMAFIEAIGPRLQREVSASVHYEARINGSLFRINRDIRFSADKTPYKDHLDMSFWQGDKRGWLSPGFYLRLTMDRLTIGAGLIHLAKEQLPAYRAAVLDSKYGPELAEIVAGIEAAGYGVSGAQRKTVPKGFDPGHERARFLRHEGLFAADHGDIPDEISTPGFVDYCLERYKAFKPLNDWVLRAMPAQP